MDKMMGVATKAGATHDHPAVDHVARALADETSTATGLTYTGWAFCGLPHSKRGLGTSWHRDIGPCALNIQTGLDRAGAAIGIPYGATARMILLYLQSEAMRRDDPKVPLGASMAQWLERLGVAVGGNTYALVTEQARRLSSCTLSFHWHAAEGEVARTIRIVDTQILPARSSRQGSLWREEVTLAAEYFEDLRDHHVTLWEPAVRALSGSSLALDLHVWLAYRLPALDQPLALSWADLHRQFGGGYKAVRQFRPMAAKALTLAIATYPGARLDITDSMAGSRAGGVILHPAPPPTADGRRARRARLALVDPAPRGGDAPASVMSKAEPREPDVTPGFPPGTIRFSQPWSRLFEQSGCRADRDLVAEAFRAAIKKGGHDIATLDQARLEKRFTAFLARYRD